MFTTCQQVRKAAARQIVAANAPNIHAVKHGRHQLLSLLHASCSECEAKHTAIGLIVTKN